jgi:hypothetical protein
MQSGTELARQEKKSGQHTFSSSSTTTDDSSTSYSSLYSTLSSSAVSKEQVFYTPTPADKLLPADAKQSKESEGPVDKLEPLPHSSTLQNVIIKSELHNDNPESLAQGIVTAFNKGYTAKDKEKVFTLSDWRGERVNQSEFLLAVRNSKPYLHTYNRQMVALVINTNPTVTLERKGKFNLNQHFYFGVFGRYVLNVPVGKYALASQYNNPVIFGEGVHVIHDPNFKFEDQTGFVDQNKPYIQHKTIHILRVNFGDIAKVTVNSVPLLLEPSTDPYVFVTPNFKFDGCEPATKNLIVHKSVKRVMPKNGEVAITTNGGTLEIIKPSSKPTIITSPTHEVTGFLPTNRQTLLLPTERTKKERAEENHGDLETNLEIFRTSDSLEIGIKILVIYEISDPDTVLQRFSHDTIDRHIEHTAVVDMGKAIQGHSSGDFLASSGSIKQAVDVPDPKQSINTILPSAPILQSLQDEVMTTLSRDLLLVGITLIRVNVELPKIIDKKIAEQMGLQSLTVAEANAKQSILAQETVIARTEAQRDAQVAAIQTDQRNVNALKIAQNKIAVAKEEAKALDIATNAQYAAQEKMGKLYVRYPILVELKKAEILAAALQNATISITPGQFQSFFGTAANNPFGLFKPASITTRREEDVIEHGAEQQTPNDVDLAQQHSPSPHT